MIESVVDVFFLYTYVQVQIRVEDTTVVRNKTDKQWNFFFFNIHRYKKIYSFY